MAKKVWKPGEHISIKVLNELQRKADEYDRILPEYRRLTAEEAKPEKSEKK